MHNYESKQERSEAQEIQKFLNKLKSKDYHWGYGKQINISSEEEKLESENLISSSLALKIITAAVYNEGYFVGLGNLEDTLLKISLNSSPDTDLSILEHNYKIENRPLPEEILSTFESLAKDFGELNSKLKDAYLKNLELSYSNIIENCTQEYECINEQLLEAEQRASIIGIDKEQIQKLRKNIESWAYTQETEVI